MIRLLLLADTHLGLDLPVRPRTRRRARGEDLFASYRRALEPARRREVDAVVHGGDLLYRSRVSRRLVSRAVEPLLTIADAGIPVFLVPGNHERSALPFPLLAVHPRLHVFDRPRTHDVEVGGGRLSVAGFPYARDVRARFRALLEATGWDTQPADARLLVVHQCIEGARVGIPEHVFRDAADVIEARDLPSGVAAVLSGHVHRAQRLSLGPDGPLPAPVIYPGSVERISIAERRERKGYVILHVEPGREGGRLAHARFEALPTRPMHLMDVGVGARPNPSWLRSRLAALSPDAVVRVRLPPGTSREQARAWARLAREAAPPTQSLDVRPAGLRRSPV